MIREEDAPSQVSNKYGNVKKCPNCGETVEAMAVKCNACGYEFRNVEALKSSQMLANKLEEIDLHYRKGLGALGLNEMKQLGEKATAVKNFPIPTTKEDLLDFAITMQSRWNSEAFDILRSAYKAKYDECINKIKMLFPNEPAVQGLLEQYEKDKKKISPKTKTLIGIGLFMLFIIILMILIVFLAK